MQVVNLETLQHLHRRNRKHYEEVGAIAPRETPDLVASTAENMGISLSIEDVTAIAENFDYASSNSDDELEEIKVAITALVEHKAALSRQKITDIVEEVRETIHI